MSSLVAAFEYFKTLVTPFSGKTFEKHFKITFCIVFTGCLVEKITQKAKKQNIQKDRGCELRN